jgi:hypothetical protein
MVDPRLAEGKRAEFNANFTDENVSYAIVLRNGIVAITDQPNKGPDIKLTKDDWSKLILGETTFEGLGSGLKAFDQALGRRSVGKCKPWWMALIAPSLVCNRYPEKLKRRRKL